jgi:Golgi phosphoprotein 3 GPP34
MCTLFGGTEGSSVLLLADDFYFVAHDSISMKCRLSDRAVRLGLAGALLGEQVLFRRINLRGGRMRIIDSTPPRDALAHTVLDHLRAEPDVMLGDWLRFFARDAYEKVSQRLIREGHVHVREERRFLRVTTVLEPTMTTRSGWPESRLASRLSKGAALDPPDIVLAGLVAATGLDAYVLADAPPQARPYLRRLVSSLPPSLREVIAQTAAAVGDSVLNART